MWQVKQQQIVESLTAMPLNNGFSRFELEDAAASGENIELIRFGERLMIDRHWQLEFQPRHAVGEFAFIDTFVKEPPELIVDGVDMRHHLKGKARELFLGDASRWGLADDWHKRNGKNMGGKI